MRFRNSHGFPSQADSRESDIHSQVPISESINTALVYLATTHGSGVPPLCMLKKRKTSCHVCYQATASNEDPRTIASIGKTVKRLTELLQAMQMSPSLKLMDEWATVLEGGDAAGEMRTKPSFIRMNLCVCVRVRVSY